MKLTKILFYLLPVIAFTLLIWQVKTAQELASLGHTVQKINQQIDLIKDENQKLAEEVASVSALLNIEYQAISMGFVQPASNQFINLRPAEFSVALPASR